MSTASIPNSPRIAIIGGGPGGLSLLLTLAKRGVHATLYERDTDRDARAHLGGMLDLDWETGQRALRENGQEEAFKKNSRRDAEEMRIGGKDGAVLVRLAGSKPTDDLKDAHPEIDRRVLRDLLLEAIPADAATIKWGHALTSIRPLDGGLHELAFANGLLTTADLVVGADGANSRVRPLLSPATPVYQGVNGVEISLAPDVAALPENEDISNGVGPGSFLVIQDNKALAFQRNGDGRIRVYAWHRNTLDWALPSDPKEAKAALLEIYHDWAPWTRKLIQLADESAIYPRPLFALPVGHRWEHKPGITLIGDAAHQMSPFAGAGANLAMYDGLELGLAIADAVSKGLDAEGREAVIAGWEEKMFAKAEEEATETARNLEASLSLDAPQSMVAIMKAHEEKASTKE